MVSLLKSSGAASCPLCRRQILDPSQDSDKSAEQIMDAFSTARSPGCPIPCHSRRNRDWEQRDVCRTCPNPNDVCEKCGSLHFRFHALSGHKDDQCHDLALGGLLFCGWHEDRLADVLCYSHLQAVCRACANADHGNCEDKKTLVRGTMGEDDLVLLSLLEKQRAAATTLQEMLQQLRHLRRQLRHLWRPGVENNLLHHVVGRSEKLWTRLDVLLRACRQRMSDALAEFRGQGPGSQCRGSMTDSGESLNHETEAWDKPLSQVMDHVVHALGQLDPSSFLSPDGVVTVPKTIVDNIPDLLEQSVAAGHAQEVFQFHTNHGSGIVLSHNDTTATKICPDVHRDEIVVSCQPMLEGCLYEVLIEKTTERFTWLYTGALCVPPGALTLFSSEQCSDYAVIIYEKSVVAFGKKTSNTCGRLLKNPQQGSRVGVLLDLNDRLHLYVDGRHQGVAARDLQQPCYAMFDFMHGVEQITALPVSTIL